MNRISRMIREAGPWGFAIGSLVVAVLALAFAAATSFNPPEKGVSAVRDAVSGEERVEPNDLSMGAGLPEKGVGAAPDTTYPRFTSTRTKVEWKPSKHWSPRGINDPKAIVVHVGGISPDKCDPLANYLTSNDRLVSAHFVVCEEKIIQEVEIGDAAHHAGIWGARQNLDNPLIKDWWQKQLNPNLQTVGIETPLNFGYYIDNFPAMKEHLIEVLVWLVEELNIPPNRTYIIEHSELDGVNRASDPNCCMALDGIVAEVARRVFTDDGQGVPIPTPEPQEFPQWDGGRFTFEGGRENGWSWAPEPSPWGEWFYKNVPIWDFCDLSWNGRHSPIAQIWVNVGQWVFFESVGTWIEAPRC